MRIKRTAVMIAAAILLCMLPVMAHGYEQPQFVKVGLKYGNSAPLQCKIGSPAGFILGHVSDEDGFIGVQPLPGYRELTAAAKAGCVELRDNNGVLISADIGVNGCLMPYSPDAGCVSLDGVDYRGGIMIKCSDDNKLTVINYISTEEYLYGVLHREIGMKSPAEALKAQAVTARTFTALNINKHSNQGFDLCNATHCQVYGGYKDEYESTNKAVDDTAGMIIYCRDKPAATNYYKNSGGYTQNSEEVWSQVIPNLRAVPDPYSPNYPWQATMDFTTLRQKLIQAGTDPGDINSVRIGGRNGTGAVSSLVISGNNGEVKLEKARIREVLGASLVRSTHFSIGQTHNKITPGQMVSKISLISENRTEASTAPGKVYIMSKGDLLQSREITALTITNGVTVVNMASGSLKAPANSTVEGVATDGTLVLTGLGYGHGVGMAQDGAIEMAKQGMSYLDILDFYYTGIEVY
ncbi:SpoIID/LytB domain-containing protein [Bacillota bacterium]